MYNCDMELRHLKYFVAVATELNFSRASETQLVAQPALSTQIADLEREIGTPLLFRTKRVVRLTPAGVVFLKEARRILAAAEDAKARALRAASGEVGELSIAFFSAPTMRFLPDLIRRYRLVFPNVSLRMLELTPDKQLEAFKHGEIDVGFTRPLPPGTQGLSSQLLFEERLLVVLPESHRLAVHRRLKLEQLAEQPFVLLERSVAPGLHDQITSACRKAGFSPQVQNSPTLMTTVLMLVAAEQGLSIVPEGVKNLRSDRLVFIPISPKLEPVPLLMCWSEQSSSPTLLEFRKQVNSQLHFLKADFNAK
jgi:DNA-binding transcriptional LysR family regulator